MNMLPIPGGWPTIYSVELKIDLPPPVPGFYTLNLWIGPLLAHTVCADITHAFAPCAANLRTQVRGKDPADPGAVKTLQIVDTCFYYPEDRWISESVRISRELGQQIEVA